MTMKVGTLFSGIGAPEYAMKSLGIPHTVEFACDNDPYVKQTYLGNHSCRVFFDDISTIRQLPFVDILFFGFPCQPFSLAGEGKGMADLRGRLVLQALKLIQKSRPAMFVAENVEGLITRDGGNTFKKLLKRMGKMGYKVSYGCSNSIEFGVPQNRSRVWIVGADRNIDIPVGQGSHPSLATVLDRRVRDNVYATADFLSKPKVIKRMESYRKDSINCITHTISRNGSSSEYISYVAAVNHAIGEARKPTVDECRRLFGFPEGFGFPPVVPVTRRYGMFANSMVVPVVAETIKQIV